MDERFLNYYQRELEHLRGMSGEFAEAYPKIASRLRMNAFECLDPYAERLLEGFAFLTARVQMKFDSGFPRFTESILQSVYPQALSPVPSMLIAEYTPEASSNSLSQGVVMPRGSSLTGRIAPDTDTACEFRTSQDVTLWPIKLAKAKYITRELGDLATGSAPAAAGLQLTLETIQELPFNQLPIDDLPIFIRANHTTVMSLLESISVDCLSVAVRDGASGEFVRLEADAVQQVGYTRDEALLPTVDKHFRGYRMIQEYFCFPDKFMFFRLKGLKQALSKVTGRQAQITILLRNAREMLTRQLDHSNLRLFCTPAINLFPKRSDRILIRHPSHEHHLVPDRIRPRDFEVHSVQRLTGYGEGNRELFSVKPFYSSTATTRDDEAAYFTLHRRPRLVPEQGSDRRSTYVGTEVFVSFSGPQIHAHNDDLKEIGTETLCTNRDLPLLMPVSGQNDLFPTTQQSVRSVQVIVGPSSPREHPGEGHGAWVAISQLRLNYLSLTSGSDGPAALCELLSLNCQGGDDDGMQHVNGLVDVQSRQITRRIPGPGPITFGQGLEVTLTFDERMFVGTGCFLLGAVLREYLAHHITVNSFVETVIKTLQRGEIKRFNPIFGHNYIL